MWRGKKEGKSTVCIRSKIVTVGDPRTFEVTVGGLSSPDITMLTYDEAWVAVAMATLGAILVWAETGSPNFLIAPIVLVLVLRESASDAD